MKISILDAQHTIFEGTVSMVILPGADGELSLLDDHEPIFAALAKGYIQLVPDSKRLTVQQTGAEAGSAQQTREIKPVFVNRGLARMRNNELVILVE